MECGDCTLCCTLCPIEELNKAAGVACDHCTIGCSIYDDRPDACAEFSCAYHQMKSANVAMRPDKLGVVFEKLDDDLMFGSVNPEHEDFRHMHGQIGQFLKEGINVVLMKKGSPTVYHVDDVSPEGLLKRVYEIARK